MFTPYRIWTTSRKLEFAQSYLACLTHLDKLSQKGITTVEHKQPVAYYEGLLACLRKPPSKNTFVDYSMISDHVELAEEGEATEEEGEASDGEHQPFVGRHVVDQSSKVYFGPFVGEMHPSDRAAAVNQWFAVRLRIVPKVILTSTAEE